MESAEKITKLRKKKKKIYKEDTVILISLMIKLKPKEIR